MRITRCTADWSLRLSERVLTLRRLIEVSNRLHITTNNYMLVNTIYEEVNDFMDNGNGQPNNPTPPPADPNAGTPPVQDPTVGQPAPTQEPAPEPTPQPGPAQPDGGSTGGGGQ